MKFNTPRINQKFSISTTPEWPSVVFKTDSTGQHTWHWTIEWGKFKKTGKETTPGNTWDAKKVITNYGGKLTVRAEANKQDASITVVITGTNPTPHQVRQYLVHKAHSAGFDKIIEHETRFKHFNLKLEPVKSFDNGYGMCQLTTPTPSYEQVWNWKRNVDGGLALFENKRKSAIAYLTQSKRTYTNDQVKYETVSRWNGGSYHEWDSKKQVWVRHKDVLCDTKTGNIGWDLSDTDNSGKTESELHKRDSSKYSKGPGNNARWKYSGVCYADKILN